MYLTPKEFINNCQNNIRNEKIKQTLPVTYTYKKSKQVAKIGYQTATIVQYQFSTTGSTDYKNIATKMVDSELWNKNKKSKAKLTNQNS